MIDRNNLFVSLFCILFFGLVNILFAHVSSADSESRIRCYFSGNSEMLSCSNTEKTEESCTGLRYCSFTTTNTENITVQSSIGTTQSFDISLESAHFYVHQEEDAVYDARIMSTVDASSQDQPLTQDLERVSSFVIIDSTTESQGFIELVNLQDLMSQYNITELPVRMVIRDQNNEFVTSSALDIITIEDSIKIYAWDSTRDYIRSHGLYRDFRYSFSIVFDPNSTVWSGSSSDRIISFEGTIDNLFPPTIEPTMEPTPEPTIEPTMEPTPEPTIEPTMEPTPEPTIEPTMEPTPEPTIEPTIEPTMEPTPEPTIEPTVFDLSPLEMNTEFVGERSDISAGYIQVTNLQDIMSSAGISQLPMRMIVRDSSGGFVASSSLTVADSEDVMRFYVWNSETDYLLSSGIYETLSYSFLIIFDPDSVIWQEPSRERSLSFARTVELGDLHREE